MDNDLSAFGDKEHIDFLERTGWTGREELEWEKVPSWLKKRIEKLDDAPPRYGGINSCHFRGRHFDYTIEFLGQNDSRIYRMLR